MINISLGLFFFKGVGCFLIFPTYPQGWHLFEVGPYSISTVVKMTLKGSANEGRLIF